jgi:hypothetical protein
VDKIGPRHQTWQTVEEIGKNLRTFLATKRDYQERHPEVCSRSENFDRWCEVAQLGCWNGASGGTDWKGRLIKSEIWKVYQEGLFDATIGNFAGAPATQWLQWLTLSTNIRSVCLQAGVPSLVTDPFGNTDRIRDHIAAEMIYTRELYKKNNQIQKGPR